MPCDTVRSTITEPSAQGTWNPVEQKSLQRNRAILLQGLLFCAQNTVLGGFSGILAQKTAISFARIDRTDTQSRMALAPEKGRGPRSGKDHRRLCICSDIAKTLPAFPVVLEAEVFAIAVVEMAGL